MSLLQNSNAITPSGFNINQSLNFPSATNTAKLYRTLTSAGSTSPKWTFATWYKKGRPTDSVKAIYASDASPRSKQIAMGFQNDVIAGGAGVRWHFSGTDWDTDANAGSAGGTAFRDYSAWYHLMHVIDYSTSPYVYIYINGVLQDVNIAYGYKSGAGYATDYSFVSGDKFYVNCSDGNDTINGYVAHTYWIEQQALLPTAFGEFDSDTNQWNPIEYSGTYSGNSFFLDYADASDWGKDVSGLGNHFTTSGTIAAWRQSIDTPQNTSGGNFAVINGRDTDGNGTWGTGALSGKLDYGNLNIGGSGVAKGRATFPLDEVNGSYWEVRWGATTDANCGILKFATNSLKTSSQIGADPAYAETGYKGSTGVIDTNGSTEATYATAASGDIIAFAYKAGRLYVGKVASAGAEATWFNSGNPSSGTGYVNATAKTDPFGQNWTAGFGISHIVNFGANSSFAGNETAQNNKDANGNGEFWGSVPTGFLAMCSSNLADVTINKPEEHFNSVLYTGTGSNPHAITGVGFQPDMVWIKPRTCGGGNGCAPWITDSVREATKELRTDTDALEGTDLNGVVAFGSDGFSVGTGGFNYSGDLFVGWNWKAGGTPTTDNVASPGNTPTSGSVMINGSASSAALAGNIAAKRISANTTNGFSMIKYEGVNSATSTVGHGLSVAPDLVIVKRLDANGYWITSSPQIGNGASGYPEDIYLNETSAQQDDQIMGGDPTASVIQIRTSTAVNASGGDYIAYCWHSVEGYSKVGQYTGNGLAEGRFVYTGFRPSWVLLKCFNTGGSWPMVDIERNEIGSSSTAGHNGTVPRVRANTAGIEDDDNRIDLVSNGFKIPVSYAESNGNGNSYIYLAFAKSPFKTSRAR